MTDASVRPHGAGDDRFPAGRKMSKLQDVSTHPPPALLVCLLNSQSIITVQINVCKSETTWDIYLAS